MVIKTGSLSELCVCVYTRAGVHSHVGGVRTCILSSTAHTWHLHLDVECIFQAEMSQYHTHSPLPYSISVMSPYIAGQGPILSPLLLHSPLMGSGDPFQFHLGNPSGTCPALPWSRPTPQPPNTSAPQCPLPSPTSIFTTIATLSPSGNNSVNIYNKETSRERVTRLGGPPEQTAGFTTHCVFITIVTEICISEAPGDKSKSQPKSF